MKSAKELFEELGFDLVETTPYMMYYHNEENDVYIWFYNNSKTIEIVNEFTLDILQVINKQVNELGWYGKNDNDNLKISYEIKPSFTTRKIKELEQERDLYKEVIEEVRKYIEDWLFDAGGNGASMTYEDINELLQILDKIIGDDK